MEELTFKTGNNNQVTRNAQEYLTSIAMSRFIYHFSKILEETHE
jgi:hypothetical protein